MFLAQLFARPKLVLAVFLAFLILGQGVALAILWQSRGRWKAEAAKASEDVKRTKADLSALEEAMKAQAAAVDTLKREGARAEARVAVATEQGNRHRREAQDLALKLVASQRVSADPVGAMAWGSSVCRALGEDWKDLR